MAFKEVDLALCRPNKDFGRGFYLSPDRHAAERMAIRTTKRFEGRPFVMSEVPQELKKYELKW